MSCYHPNLIRSPYNEKAFIYVPCGKCPGCLRDKQNQWYLRFIEEDKTTRCRFITLTYDENSIPKSIDQDGCIHYEVCKEDLQKFFKRMRKSHKFKYFAVSEYGSNTQRPHYHLLLFSNDNIDIAKFWRFGYVLNLPASRGAFRYVTKYILKGSNVPEGSSENFMICSKRPAIGKGFVDFLKDKDIDSLIDKPILRDHEVVYPLPRYYRKKIYENFDDNGENIKKRIIEKLESNIYSPMYAKFLENHDKNENFYKWLRNKENSQTRKQCNIKIDKL